MLWPLSVEPLDILEYFEVSEPSKLLDPELSEGLDLGGVSGLSGFSLSEWDWESIH